jgi:hypothetical protein
MLLAIEPWETPGVLLSATAATGIVGRGRRWGVGGGDDVALPIP